MQARPADEQVPCPFSRRFKFRRLIELIFEQEKQERNVDLERARGIGPRSSDQPLRSRRYPTAPTITNTTTITALTVNATGPQRQKDLPMNGSIRPAYSTASHTRMEESAIALSARLESNPSSPSGAQAFLNTVR